MDAMCASEKTNCMNNLLRLLLICCTVIPGIGSTQTAVQPAARQGPDRIIRLSLGHLFDPVYPGPHIGYEHRLHGNVYLRHEAGVILDFNYPEQPQLLSLLGFRLRTTRRTYHDNPGLIRRRVFHEWSFDYRYFAAQIAGDFSRDGGAFIQRIDYQLTQHSWSFSYLKGISWRLGKSWQLDTGIGLGLRLNNRNYSDIPLDATFSTNGGLAWQVGSRAPWHTTVAVPVIFALGYQF